MHILAGSWKGDLSRANRVMETAGDRASEWWSGRRYSTYSDSEVNELCRKYDEKKD